MNVNTVVKKHIAIVGIMGVPAKYGGFESLVENMLDYTPQNISYTVYCSGKSYIDRQSEYKGAQLQYINMDANGVSSILYDIVSMWKSRKHDVLLLLGVSGAIFLPFLRIFYRGKVVTNVDGIEWKREKWNRLARFILKLSERLAVRFSDEVIADNQGIVDYLQKAYRTSSTLIEYGADQATLPEDFDGGEEYTFISGKYAVTVCRIEPENNIEPILKAFSSEKVEIPLVIVGNWQNSEYGKNLYARYSSKPGIFLLNPIYDIKTINYIRGRAVAYIHGHSAGGTNPSLVEAMNLGLPIYSFDCVYNRQTTEDQAYFWTDENHLRRLLTDQRDTSEAGKRMKTIAQKRYQWKIIAEKYVGLF